jgi:hypothetical protein
VVFVAECRTQITVVGQEVPRKVFVPEKDESTFTKFVMNLLLIFDTWLGT